MTKRRTTTPTGHLRSQETVSQFVCVDLYLYLFDFLLGPSPFRQCPGVRRSTTVPSRPRCLLVVVHSMSYRRWREDRRIWRVQRDTGWIDFCTVLWSKSHYIKLDQCNHIMFRWYDRSFLITSTVSRLTLRETSGSSSNLWIVRKTDKSSLQ